MASGTLPGLALLAKAAGGDPAAPCAGGAPGTEAAEDATERDRMRSDSGVLGLVDPAG